MIVHVDGRYLQMDYNNRKFVSELQVSFPGRSFDVRNLICFHVVWYHRLAIAVV